MNKINTLVEQIKGALSESLQKRIDKLQKLEKQLEDATLKNTNEPSEANQQYVDDLNETIVDYTEDLVSTLELIIAEEAKTQKEPIVEKEEKEVKEEKKSSGLGWALLGGVLVVLTLGAYSINKNR